MKSLHAKAKSHIRKKAMDHGFSDFYSWVFCKKTEPTRVGELVWNNGGREKFKEELWRLLGYIVTAAGIGAVINDSTRSKLFNYLNMGLQHLTKDAHPYITENYPYILAGTALAIASSALIISSDLLIKSRTKNPKPSDMAQSMAKTALGTLYCAISAALNITFDFLLLKAGVVNTMTRLALSTCLATCTWVGMNELSKLTNEKGLSMVKFAKATAYSFAGNIESTLCCASR